ncbi:hypothetical protein AVEN_272183-1 [Araneus ventricosus]|uniref:Uncharacterized protein n=1 Tax=Araneus ventricosus TaxID=182803 RepID=A0A4Y2HVW3_ARAVE|nr:hypothetical protein AVEN_272183-1 [Araneus ventricosus]
MHLLEHGVFLSEAEEGYRSLENFLRFSNPPDGTIYLLLVNGRSERRLCKKPQFYKELLMRQIRSFGGVGFTDPSSVVDPDPQIRFESGT